MVKLFIESVSDPLRVSLNILAFVIPYGIYKINQRLHKWGDPPWKKEDPKTKK